MKPRSRSMPRFTAFIAATSLLLAACSRAGDDTPETSLSRIDTIAGLIQVTNPEAPPEFWGFEQVLTLGKLEAGDALDPEVFGRIASIVADAEGNVYVADYQAREVRVFDRSGSHLRTIGRSGEGPGEFGALASLTWVADTLHALDWGNGRIQRFTRAGEEAGTIRWIRLSGPSIRFYQTSDRRIHTLGLRRRTGELGTVPHDAFLVYDEGELVDSLAVAYRTPLPPFGVECVSPEAVMGYMSPLSPRRIAVPAGDGKILYAMSSEYRISVLDAAGDTVRQILREGGGHRPVPDEAWAAVEDSIRAMRSRAPAGSTCSAELERPSALPVLADLLYDQEGRLVVEVETDNGFAFDFYDTEYRHLARAPSPPRDRRVPPYFRDGILYLATRGEFDLPGVAVYRIARP